MEKENPQKCNVEHLKMVEEIIARLANNAFNRLILINLLF